MDLQTLKGFLRIDGSENDIVLTSLIRAAESHLRNAGVVKVEINEELTTEEIEEQEGAIEQYNLAIMLYVKREYDHHTGLELERIKESIQGIILQLRDYEIEEEE